MPKSVLEKLKVSMLVLALLIVVTSTALTPAVSAAPTVPSTNNYPYVYDPDFNSRNPDYWQVGLVGSYPRQSQNLPEGYWYPNTAFDSAWFENNYAVIGTPVGNSGTVTLRAHSEYDLTWGGRGWSNAFVHQGSPVYTNVYEGRFKAGSTPSSAITVDGIKYNLFTTEPTNKHYIHIKAILSRDDLNYWQSNNGLLICFIFQYEYPDGSLSLYNYPANTNHYQSVHFDIFIHRTFKLANIPFSYPSGTWYNTLGDAYNGDLHEQYVYNGKMNVGQWYDFYIDFGDAINKLKYRVYNDCIDFGLPIPQNLILKYIQISAETIGGDIEAVIDTFEFITY